MVAAVLDAAGEYSDAQQIRRCADCRRDRLACWFTGAPTGVTGCGRCGRHYGW
jgi:hypothetical protein